MKVINRVEVSKEELDAILKVSNLDCSGHCDDCPLHLSNNFTCIKCFAKYTLENVDVTLE